MIIFIELHPQILSLSFRLELLTGKTTVGPFLIMTNSKTKYYYTMSC